MVLRLISRSPRRSGLFVTVVSRVFSQDLTPASRRQTPPPSPSAKSALVFGATRVHRIPPRVRDDRERPSEGRDRIAIFLFLPWRQVKFGKSEIDQNTAEPGWVAI